MISSCLKKTKLGEILYSRRSIINSTKYTVRNNFRCGIGKGT